MANLFLDITSGQDPNGSILVTLDDSDVSGFEMRGGENELGSGSFTIRRDHPDATEANLAKGNYVKVRIPLIQVEPVFGFFIDEHDDTLISTDEEGGEYLMRGGPGTLFILAQAVLLDKFYVVTQHSRGNYNVPGNWTWTIEPYGAIMTRLVEEGQDEPGSPLGDVTITFNRQNDSDGNPWPTVNEEIQFPIGSDGLSVMRTLVDSGELYLRPEPDFTINGYIARGDDLTGTAYGTGVVRFVKGENILTGLDREGHGTRAATHAIVVGKDMTYRRVTSPDYVPGTTGRWITVDYPESNDTALLDKVGLQALQRRADDQNGLELEFLAGNDEANGRYLPFLHFKTGDLVSVDTGTDPWDYQDEPFRMVGFRIVLGEASRDATDEESARSFRWIAELGSGATTGGMGAGAREGGGCQCLTLCHDTIETTIFDSGNRTEVGQWGEPDYGPPDWFDSGSATLSADGTHLVAVVGSGADVTVVYQDLLNFDLPWQSKFTMRSVWEYSDALTGVQNIGCTWRTSSNGSDEAARVSLYFTNDPTDDSTLTVTGPGGSSSVVLPTNPPPDTPIYVVWEWTANGLNRAKVWWDATPDDWMVSRSDVNITNESRRFSIITDQDNTQTLKWDYIIFDSVASTCIVGGPLATSGADDDCNHAAAPCNHDHKYTSAQVSHGDGTVEDALNAGTGAPDDATYLVTAAHADLSAEVVVGATPGGELGGTWAAPTVDATHSGSAHHAENHASRHANGGADEVAVEGLGTAATDTTLVLSPNGTGGVEFRAETGGGGGMTLEPETPVGTIDGVNDDFTLSTTPDGLILVKNGLVQRVGSGNDYTITGNTITYEAGNLPQTGDSHVAYLTSPADILDLATAETDTTLVLAPDGLGGVEFRAEAGGGGGITDVYGNGEDGNVTINSGAFSVSVGGSALITNNVLLRDAYFDTLTLNGGDLITNGFKVFAWSLVMTSGVIRYAPNNGGAGGNGSAAAGGAAGAAAAANSAGTLAANVAGQAGVIGGFGGNGVNGGVSLQISTAGWGTSPNGVAGGISGQGQTGGTGGTSTTATNTATERPADYAHASLFRFSAGTVFAMTTLTGAPSISGSGAGSASSGGGGSGGNGASGGPIVVFAKTITGTTNIQSIGGTGGNGGNGGGTNSGGGGAGQGGNGGFICLIYSDQTGWSGTLDVSGGAGGTGGTLAGTGANGANGNQGRIGKTASFQVNA